MIVNFVHMWTQAIHRLGTSSEFILVFLKKILLLTIMFEVETGDVLDLVLVVKETYDEQRYGEQCCQSDPGHLEQHHDHHHLGE